MAVTITAYDHLWKLLLTGAVDLDTDSLKVALVTSAYAPNVAHTQWEQAFGSEASSGGGYTSGGVTLANPVATNNTVDYDDVMWTNLTKTFRYAVCYAQKSVAGLTNPLLFWLLLDSTPADVISSGSNYTIQWHSIDKVFYRPA